MLFILNIDTALLYRTYRVLIIKMKKKKLYIKIPIKNHVITQVPIIKNEFV